RTPEQKKLAEQGENLIKVTWDEILEALTPEERAQRAAWRAQINTLEAQMPPPAAEAWTIAEHDPPPATYLLKRGDPKRKGVEVQPAFLRVLLESSDRVAEADRVAGAESSKPRHDGQNRGIEDSAPAALQTSRLNRLDLARWLTRPDNPLTARVLVNRLWQHHFGQGLVRTPNNFGKLGEPPTHPELLDYLAHRFIQSGWSIKAMHRLIMLSEAYQQSSAANAETLRADADNRLFGRMNRRRLEAEPLRDSLLAVAGSLDQGMGGPAIRELDNRRRTLYLMTIRSDRNNYRMLFDAADPVGIVAKRIDSS